MRCSHPVPQAHGQPVELLVGEAMAVAGSAFLLVPSKQIVPLFQVEGTKPLKGHLGRSLGSQAHLVIIGETPERGYQISPDPRLVGEHIEHLEPHRPRWHMVHEPERDRQVAQGDVRPGNGHRFPRQRDEHIQVDEVDPLEEGGQLDAVVDGVEEWSRRRVPLLEEPLESQVPTGKVQHRCSCMAEMKALVMRLKPIKAHVPAGPRRPTGRGERRMIDLIERVVEHAQLVTGSGIHNACSIDDMVIVDLPGTGIPDRFLHRIRWYTLSSIMEELLLEILDRLKEVRLLDSVALNRCFHRHSRGVPDTARHHSKRKLLRFYQETKENDPERWASWGVDETLEQRLLQTLQIKPGRTSGGVATISVLTKPWPCSNDCLYCPNDLRMPKSYLHLEPACMRAERNCFDPYLQVISRLRALDQMGHDTRRIELIVLGGTWSDYPEGYQIWFVSEMFRALNEYEHGSGQEERRRADAYRTLGIGNDDEVIEDFIGDLQSRVNEGSLDYNEAFQRLYAADEGWSRLSDMQMQGLDELHHQQELNMASAHQVVGLVIETRPDLIDTASLSLLRTLGCTKVQMGIQSTDQTILDLNGRKTTVGQVTEAFELLRLFGFQIHVHSMVNLLGSDPVHDRDDYQRLVSDPRFLPDEVKLYPCVLVESARLRRKRDEGAWRPYDEETLSDILVTDMLNTPPYMKISRMVRDISVGDIIAGNKKNNLRQVIEDRLRADAQAVSEIRFRRASIDDMASCLCELERIEYETTVTHEHFIQMVTSSNRLIGYLRLSIPKLTAHETHGDTLPYDPATAIVRELHMHGKTPLDDDERTDPWQRRRKLLETAIGVATERGCNSLIVNCSVGMRGFYHSLGFTDRDMYQHLCLR